jgi:hypothetical protein
MTTTISQKAEILRRWKVHRSERGLSGNVSAQCSFNWPSLSGDDRSEVLKAVEELMKKAVVTKRPSAPKRLAKHVVKCELGSRRYVENFVDDASARVFVDAVLGDAKTSWKDDETLTAKDGALVVSCPTLSDLMELEPGEFEGVELPDPIVSQVSAFLRGKWVRVEAKLQIAEKKKPTLTANDEVTLADVCARHKWEPSDVRAAMRRKKWEKPAGGWRWPKGEGIEKKLIKLMSVVP